MISNVYSYYMSQYATKPSTRHDSHKKSELRNVYNKMVSINRTAPLYKVDLSEDMQKLAIDIKEGAMELRDFTTDLNDSAMDEAESRQKATSSNEEQVGVKYISKEPSPVDSFEVMVERLATTQKNTGHFLRPQSRGLEEGEYSFDLSINDVTYELQFHVERQDTTKDVQSKIARLLNRSSIGVAASVETDALGNTALSVESESTGVHNMKPTIFHISDENTSYKKGSVDYFGLDRVVQHPGNAVFYIDGEQRLSANNSFTINRSFEIDLKQTTPEPVTIRVEKDTTAVADEIVDFVNSYNRIVDFAKKTSEKFAGGGRLLNEFERMARSYTEMLSNNGFEVSDEGRISLTDEAKSRLQDSDRIGDVLSQMEDFRNSVMRKTDNIISNPVEYLDKKVVAYKNPAKSFTSPYSSSAYAGMMFDGYY